MDVPAARAAEASQSECLLFERAAGGLILGELKAQAAERGTTTTRTPQHRQQRCA